MCAMLFLDIMSHQLGCARLEGLRMTECVIFGVVGPLIPLQVSAAQLQQKLQIFWSQEIYLFSHFGSIRSL